MGIEEGQTVSYFRNTIMNKGKKLKIFFVMAFTPTWKLKLFCL